ncbi:unnamed protein product [Durusdinium trenchii]|uniref:DNA2/NAM7 helicase helicase domain-containing protein n=1 Tax=Durusdinium trenchii TaxID=1381693 RepID=A0ABP0NUX4_9DINO
MFRPRPRLHFTHLDFDDSERGGPRRKLLEAFAGNRNDYPFLPVEDTYRNRSDYYSTMQANVMAEAVCAFHGGGGMTLNCRQTFDWLVASRCENAGNANSRPTPEPSDLQLKDNVVELNRTLFWVTECNIQEVTRNGVAGHEANLKGFALGGRRLETALADFRSEHPTTRLKVRLFAGDYLIRYRCASELQLSPPRDMMLERMVLDPTRRDPGSYAMCRSIQMHLMPINEDQERAVKSLGLRVEIIHGPPGTGKSTTIFHLLSARMPPRTASVVTCVTNQAIDAVAEKLSITHENADGLRILVLGNPTRVGKTAGNYTLDNLCRRDALVVSMKRAHNLLKKALRAAEDFQFARQQRLWKPHTRSRFSQMYIEGLPSVRRYRLELEQENLRRRRDSMPLEKYDPVKFYFDRLNSTKQKMAWAVVRSRPFRLPQKRMPLCFPLSFQNRKSWRVQVFVEHLQRCASKAQQAFRVAQDTAARRVVRNSSVFLCTIPSSYQARRLTKHDQTRNSASDSAQTFSWLCSSK